MSRKTRKLIWSAPLVAAFAVIGALAMFMTLQPNDAAAQTSSGMELPGMVQNLMVKAYADGTPQEELEVTWDAPTDGGFVDSYRIDVSDDGMRWVSYITDHGDSDLSLIYGDDAGEMLIAKQTKHFRVFAFNEDGTGPGSDAKGATTASHKPERPTELTATDGTETVLTGFHDDLTADDNDETELGFDVNGDGDAEDEDVDGITVDNLNRTIIKLSWEAPDDPPGAPVTGYRIEYSRDGNQWRHLANTEKAVTSYFHTGLRADVQLQYRIYAMNTVDRSTVSDGATGKTATSVAPGAPTTPVIGLSPAATDVHLKWTKPTDPAGDPVTHYRIQARASTADDSGTWLPLHAGKHIAVTNVYNFGGRDLGRAKIEYPATIPTTGDNTTSLVVIDVRIAAINRVNTDSTDAEIATATGWLTIEDVPVGHEDAPKKAGTPRVKHDQTQHQGRSGLDVTWPKATFIAGQGPDDATFATGVTYILVIDGEEQTAVPHGTERDGTTPPTNALLAGGDETKPGHDDDGLATEKERMYQVYALNGTVTVTGASVRGFPSNTAKGKTARPKLPGQAESLVVTADGHTEIKLMWTAPMTSDTANNCVSGDTPPTENDGSECGDSVITGYQIQMSKTGTSGWQTLKSNDKDDKTPDTIEMSPYIAKMLTPGERYHFRVAALNSRGKGQYSEVKSEETHDPGQPTPPGGLVGQAEGSTMIKLCWYEQNLVDPLTGDERLDEGLPVLGYKITYQKHSTDAAGKETVGSEMTLVEDTGSKNTEHTVRNLTPGTKYTFKVRSITLGGVGEKYTEATAMTADAMAPAAPTGVTATATSDTQVTVRWTAPADPEGAPVTGYKVMWKMSSATDYDDANMAEVMADARMYQVTGLTASTGYTFKVMAVNAKGDSMAAEAMETTAADNMAPTKVGTISDVRVTVGQSTAAMDVSGYFADADMDDTLTYTAMSSMPSYATADIPTGSNMLTIAGVAVGSATITVTANDGNGGMVSQMFTVTVNDMLTAPSIVSTNPVGSGLVTVTWTTVSGAAGYTILAINLADSSDYQTEPINNPGTMTNQTAQIDDLTPDVEYLIFVAAFDADDFELSAFRKITAE